MIFRIFRFKESKKNLKKILIDDLFLYGILYLMEAISYSDLRKNLKKHMDNVYFGHYPLIINRKNSENLVMISLDQFNSFQETNYLLASEANAKH